MFGDIELGSEFFEGLTAFDAEIAARVEAAGCRFCGARLYRGDYPRKPRGGIVAIAAESFVRRFSFCCGRDGCRRRATPPSIRFLGRRVYVGAAVLVASVIALAGGTSAAVQRATGIASRTTRRWLRWWRGPFVTTAVFVDLAARIVGLDRFRLPASVVEQMSEPAVTRVRRILGWLAPLTAMSIPSGSRFVRGVV